MIPITFRFIIPLTWCHRWSITSSLNLSTNVSWSSSAFRVLPGYQLNSWWEVPSLPSMSCFVIDHFIAFPPTQTCSCSFYTLSSLLSNICSSLPWNTTTFYVKNVVVILPPLENSWYSNISRLLRWFLGPRVDSNRNTGNWTLRCEFKTSSNPIAWSEWLIVSF